MKRFSSITWLTIVSLAIGLFFLWAFLLVSFSSKTIITSDALRPPVLVEMESDPSETMIQDVIKFLESQEIINHKSISSYSEEYAQNVMAEEFITDDSLILESPFSTIITFRWSDFDVSDQKKISVTSSIEDISGVRGVYVEEIHFDEFEENIEKLKMVSFVCLTILAIFSIVLLYNVIRLFLVNDEKKIKTMLLVGAEQRFILVPYVRSTLLIGLVAFFLSCILILLVYFTFQFALHEIEGVLSLQNMIISTLVVLLVGMMLPSISTYIIIRLYLRKL